jgi:hypothetical protein
MKIITRQEAIEEGLVNYYSGRPCKRGHMSERRTLTAACIECLATRTAYILERQEARRKRLAEAEASRETAAV